MKKMIPVQVVVVVGMLMAGCKSKATTGIKKEDAFPILPVIKSQVAHIDTSLYQILKLTSRDSTWDTVYLKREEFNAYANEFLNLPDLTKKELTGQYEESKFFDETLNRAIFTYSAKDKSAIIQKEEITIAPGDNGNDKMKNIIIDKLENAADSSVTKHMLWNVDQSFQITSVIQKQGKPDSTQTIRITWQ